MKSLVKIIQTRPAVFLLALVPLFACTSSDAPLLLEKSGAERFEVNVQLPVNAYFGDLHVHSALSPDAYIQGTRATVDDAYRYAKGEAIDHVSGRPIQAKRALDFLAVTDHAEYLGLQEGLFPKEGEALARPVLESVRLPRVFLLMMESMQSGTPHLGWLDEEKSRNAWAEIIDTANRHDDPGRFSTLVGFEWSSSPGGRNLHRNVIFGPTEVYPDVPFSMFDSPDPEGLWEWMDDLRSRGSQLLAIPHNSNLSDGTMFARVDSKGRPIDSVYAANRARNEPLVEVTQIKGTSETDPILSPQDEFADFEIWAGRISVAEEAPDVASEGSYARDALKAGIEMQSAQDFNPYRFGMIGSTDSHSASSPVEEDNYSGKGVLDTTPSERLITSRSLEDVQAWGASGLAGVWARDNTRAEIYAALARKETFATTGPRIRLRFFGGWKYDAEMLNDPDWISLAYSDGVSMGGDLRSLEVPSATPRFVVSALKDPEGANLDRLQVVKGWVVNGQAEERVFDVAMTDLAGAAQLAVVWRDPAFDPSVESFYYVRVLQKPTARWTMYDAKSLGIEPPRDSPSEIQERAFSSPIWYSPEG